MSSAAELGELIRTIRDNQTFARIIVASIAVTAYDTACTLEQEIRHVWGTRWTWPKVLYLTARYYPLVCLVAYFINWGYVHTSTKDCWAIVVFTLVLGGVDATLLPVNIIQYLRLSALYKHNKRVMYPILGVVIVGTLIEFISILRIVIFKGSGFLEFPPGIPIMGCSLNVSRERELSMLILADVAAFVASSTLFVALVFKVVRGYRRQARNSQEPLGFTSSFRSMSPLLQACVRDGALYFLVVEATVVIANVQILIDSQGPLQIAYVPFAMAACSIAGSRLILELREAACLNVPGLSGAPMTTLDFAGPEMGTGMSESAELDMCDEETPPPRRIAIRYDL